ncbi:ribosome silencing factor [bacterium]|mgnify:FL=1|nr:ribosome silencing factor [bacterium]MDG2366436.1 ribosome silencing factor [Candidatus Neomarinimicrobiota bacterium]
MSPSNPPKAITSSDLAAQISNFALDKKAENVISINVMNLTSFTDQFVICSADTDIQVKAIADTIRKSTDHKPIRIEGYEQLNWVLLDYIDVIVHIFKTTERNYYNIEKLWADAPIIEYNDEDFISIKSNSD